MKKAVIMGATSLAAFSYAPLALAQQTNPYHGNRHMMWGDVWYGWFLGPVMMIVFLAIAVAVIVLIVRWLGGVGHNGTSTPSAPARRHAMDILKERFARGEIDQAEFEEKRRILDD
jgi:putative membrane protein